MNSETVSEKPKSQWQTTNQTNLVRHSQSGRYYARVKVNGKEKWRALKTDVLTVAKLRLADVEREIRAQAPSTPADPTGKKIDETSVAACVLKFLADTDGDPSISPATKARRLISIKALRKTWPTLESRDIRRITANDCKSWATTALREGTGFVAPKAKATRRGMSASAFNKCVEVLTAVFEIARKQGIRYDNPVAEVDRAKLPKKRLELPTSEQFQAVVSAIAKAGSRQSKDCADMVRLLAFSGVRLAEASALRWKHVDAARNSVTIPGTKSETSYRTIPLFPPLAALLAEMQARRGGEQPKDAPILAVKECRQSLENACASVGIKRLSHHDLRHYFATRCIESGVDIPTVSKWLGHSDGGALAMRVYGHLRDQHSQTQAAKVTF